MLSIYDNGLYDELRKAAYELKPWFDIDKVKTFAVYVWTKETDPDDPDHPFGENVFDICPNHIQFYRCDNCWRLPNEVIPIITKIQEKLRAIEEFTGGPI